MKLAAAFFSIALGLSAQTMVAPLAGTMVDAHGRIALLHGVMGNLLLPQYIAAQPELLGEAILSAAFSSNGGALKTLSHLVLLDNEGTVASVQPAPDGTALFSFSADGSPAWVLYTAEAELANIASSASINASGFGGAVVALGTAGTASIPVLVSDAQTQLWSGAVSLPGGAFQKQGAVAGTPPAAFFQRGWLTTTTSGLFWTPLAAGTSGFPIALPETPRSVQMSSSGAVVVNNQWLLNSRFQVLEIPRTPPAPSKANIGIPPAKVH